MLIDPLRAWCGEELDHLLVGRRFLSIQVAVGLLDQLPGSLRTYLGDWAVKKELLILW